MINVLYLTGSFFMLEIYDRVLPSRSIPTLVGLIVLAAGLYIAQGVLDLIRGRILVRIGASLDESLSGRVFDTVARLPLEGRAAQRRPAAAARSRQHPLVPVRPRPGRAVRSALDAALYRHLFCLSSADRLTALGGAIILVTVTLLTEFQTRAPMKEATGFAIARNGLAETSRRNAEALVAMGMVGRIASRWEESNRKYLDSQQRVSDVAGGLGAISKVMRMMLQSAVLGVGAYLVINQEATAGIIIAGSILSARALAPVDLAIAHWKGFVAARQSWHRLNQILKLMPEQTAPMALQAPAKSLAVENAAVAAPGTQKIVAQDINLKLERGNGLGIIGPSGSGQVVGRAHAGRRMAAGARQDPPRWRRARPVVLGGARAAYRLSAAGRRAVRRHGGAEHRPLRAGADSAAVIAAAKAAGVHELIVGLREGYDTQIGEQGLRCRPARRSASRSRARSTAIRSWWCSTSRTPISMPTATKRLTKAILAVRARGGIVVVVAHRPSAIAGVDLLMVMKQGRQQAFGPKDAIMAKLVQPAPLPGPLKVVPEVAGGKS